MGSLAGIGTSHRNCTACTELTPGVEGGFDQIHDHAACSARCNFAASEHSPDYPQLTVDEKLLSDALKMMLDGLVSPHKLIYSDVQPAQNELSPLKSQNQRRSAAGVD